MGLDRVEHQLTLGSGGAGSAEMPQMIDLMLAHGVYYDANLQMYGGINERRAHASEMLWTDEAKYFTPYAQALLEKRGEPEPESDDAEFTQRVLELKSLFDAGGAQLLIVGTDEPVYTNLLPGFAYHRELLAMTYAGTPPAAVLKAATINGARALGVGRASLQTFTWCAATPWKTSKQRETSRLFSEMASHTTQRSSCSLQRGRLARLARMITPTGNSRSGHYGKTRSSPELANYFPQMTLPEFRQDTFSRRT